MNVSLDELVKFHVRENVREMSYTTAHDEKPVCSITNCLGRTVYPKRCFGLARARDLEGTGDFEEFAKHFNADVDMDRWGDMFEKRSNIPIKELKGLDEWPTKADFPLRKKKNKRKRESE